MPRSKSPDNNLRTMSLGLWNHTSKLESCNAKQSKEAHLSIDSLLQLKKIKAHNFFSFSPEEFQQHTGVDYFASLTIDSPDFKKAKLMTFFLKWVSRETNGKRGVWSEVTLRRSRVSAAIRPLLGSPRRISFLSDILPSALPLTLTEATWDWGAAVALHQKELRVLLLRDEGIEEKMVKEEGHFGKLGRTAAIAISDFDSFVLWVLSSLSHSGSGGYSRNFHPYIFSKLRSRP